MPMHLYPANSWQFFQGVTYNGRTEMTDMERLCDIGGGVVEADGLSIADMGRAVFLAGVLDLFQHIITEICAGDLEIKVSACSRHRAERGIEIRTPRMQPRSRGALLSECG